MRVAHHAELFKTLYPAKPKFHYLWHLGAGLRHLNANVNCFVTERKHKRVKDRACLLYTSPSPRD
eukprot:12074772-Alexandrium_andersonii.AAC.1